MIVLYLVCADTIYIPTAEVISYNAIFFFLVILKSLLLGNFLISTTFSLTAWYFKRSRPISFKNQTTHTLERLPNMAQHSVHQLPSKVLFFFLCVLIGYFQSHDKHCKYLFSISSRDEAFIWRRFSAFARIPFILSRVPSRWVGKKNVPVSYKHNLALYLLYLFILTWFSFMTVYSLSRLLSRPASHTNRPLEISIQFRLI